MDATFNSTRLCRGEVRHKRLRPARHDFSYGVYFLRIPLRTLGDSGFGTSLLSRNRFNLLSFHDADHGDGRTRLLEWIDARLRHEGIGDADGEIWLQTFPRVLGYVFNPVSFWFCHRADGSLRAVLCEVNNTFGDRHCYLLAGDDALPFGVELKARKAMHVSPFCKIEGHYRFRFMSAVQHIGDELRERVMARIDYDDAAGPLLQTSISGTLHPLSTRTLAAVFLGYPLMTFGVIFRIHWQALRLWLKRVPVFRKPVSTPREHSR